MGIDNKNKSIFKLYLQIGPLVKKLRPNYGIAASIFFHPYPPHPPFS